MSNLTKFKRNGTTWYKGECGECKTSYTFRHGNKLVYCPNPDCESNTDKNYLPHIWSKPPTEVRLFKLQEAYLKKSSIKNVIN